MEFSKSRNLALPKDRSNAVPYYVALDRGADYCLRCKDCQRLVPTAQIVVHGFCRCGNKRYMEIRTLSLWEWLRIRLGLLDFPHRADFLKEFARG